MGLYRTPQSIRGFFSLLTSRVTWTILAILAQLALLIAIVFRFQQQSVYIEGFLVILSAIMVVWIINSKKSPTYQLAWIVPILLFPVFGGLFYLLHGGNRPTPYARRKMNAIHEKWMEFAADDDVWKENVPEKLYNENRRIAGQASYIERYTLMPPLQHTRTIYFPNGEEMFAQMLIELEKAEQYIFMEYFIIDEGFMWDTILNILHKKAKQGVDVRLIYDDIGTIMRLPANYPKKLNEMGIRCEVFGPFHPILSTRFNNRDHRKITVIDGHTAFTGGANLADEYINHLHLYGYWKDSAIMLYGDAAAGFTLLFISMWDYLTGESSNPNDFLPNESISVPNDGYVQPVYSSPLTEELVSETVFRNLIGQALDTVYIYTPYLVISSEMLSTIGNAAKRGVSVHVITPGRPDNKWYVQSVGRASYQELVSAGVNIYEYQRGFLHSKVVLVDSKVAYVGTVNLDYRSMYLHFECGVMLYGSSSIEAIEHDIRETIEYDCRRITQEDLDAVPVWRRIGRSILKLFAPLM